MKKPIKTGLSSTYRKNSRRHTLVPIIDHIIQRYFR
jgi:hypothetical protein